ncbi:MAG: DNA-3-methyladenine glycosylase I [Candidatus Roizmanbacteria bacterium]
MFLKNKLPFRCPWSGNDPLYITYHDEEWGVPLHDDRKLFEFIVLEGMQAGLSWITVLRKREHYRKVFDGFDARRIAKYDEAKIAVLLADPGIIRNKLKVRGAVKNAQAYLRVQKEFGTFDRYMWSFVGGKAINNRLLTIKDYKATSPESDAMSKDLKRRGFTFVGSTICYAHMQACGMVNDHLVSCFRYHEIASK